MIIISSSHHVDREREDFHTKLWPEDYRLLKELSLKYGNIQNVVERAIQLLRIRESLADDELSDCIKKQNLSKFELAEFMLHDFKMLAVGRRTFLSYISALHETPIKENNAIELIEWYYQDKLHIDDLDLEQILIAIKELWLAGNYFNKVIIQKQVDQTPPEFKMIFYHQFNERRYGEYWSRYFRYILTQKPIDVEVKDVKVRPQSFYMTIIEKDLLKSEKNAE